jgi:hypothetical protein
LASTFPAITSELLPDCGPLEPVTKPSLRFEAA